MNALRWKRLAPGMYEAVVPCTTGNPDLARYLIESVELDSSSGWGSGTEWTITYPGACHPDSVLDTLREAKACAQAAEAAR